MFFDNEVIKKKVVKAVVAAIESDDFATQKAVYSHGGGWFSYLEGNDIYVLNYQTDEEKRAETGAFNFCIGMMTEFIDAAKKTLSTIHTGRNSWCERLSEICFPICL